MRNSISNDDATGTSWLQLDSPTVSYFDMLGISDPIEFDVDHDPTRTTLLLVSAYPESWRQFLTSARQRIARQADEDLRADIEATIAAARMMQVELDRRTYQAKLKQLDDAARDIAKSVRRIEYNTLKRRLNGKGFRQKP